VRRCSTEEPRKHLAAINCLNVLGFMTVIIVNHSSRPTPILTPIGADWGDQAARGGQQIVVFAEEK
jgi:hypothetical protein